jgi:hypothetical protein
MYKYLGSNPWKIVVLGALQFIPMWIGSCLLGPGSCSPFMSGDVAAFF